MRLFSVMGLAPDRRIAPASGCGGGLPQSDVESARRYSTSACNRVTSHEPEPLVAATKHCGSGAESSGTTMMIMRSEEHTSELQSLMRNSYAVFCLKKKTNNNKQKKIKINNTL